MTDRTSRPCFGRGNITFFHPPTTPSDEPLCKTETVLAHELIHSRATRHHLFENSEGEKRAGSEKVLQPHTHTLDPASDSGVAHRGASRTARGSSERDTLCTVLRQPHRCRKAGRLDRIAQAARIVRGRSNAHSDTEHIGREVASPAH